jgi:hypothetical protein
MTSTWPSLPRLQEFIYDLRDWPYPIADGRPTPFGHAHLRLYRSSDGGHVAVVEDSGPGLSVTNGAEHIWASLCDDFAGGPITQIELYRCARDGGPGVHFDQYTGDGFWSGHRWRPMSDIGPTHPDHDEVAGWVAMYRNVITGEVPLAAVEDQKVAFRLSSDDASFMIEIGAALRAAAKKEN